MSLKKESLSDVQLHLASLNGDISLLRRILDSGKVHVDSRDKDGTTPLILAAANGHYECVKELIEQGADARAKRITGTTPLFFAAQGGFLDIVHYLLDKGAPVDSLSVDGGSPLFVACQCGHIDVVKELIKRGAQVNTHMKDGATPLFKASHKGHSAVVGELLKYKPSLDILPNGETALHAAAFSGSLPVCKQLIAAGANPCRKNQENYTPAEIALRHRYNGVAEYLKNCENRNQIK